MIEATIEEPKTLFEKTPYGFKYGPLEVTRLCSDTKAGWVILELKTPKTEKKSPIQIYVTKTGKVVAYHNNEKTVLIK